MPNQKTSPLPLFLNCPVCKEPLNPIASGVSCTNNHQFDRARQGYINLLLGHKKRSRNPGDDKAMVEARTSFLNSGHYASIANALASSVADITAQIKRPVIVDAGCGEGYYTRQIKRSVATSEVIGFDISRPAIQACSRNDKSIQWLVASVNDIPLVDHQVDIIISVFSRCDWKEFARILKPGGTVLILGPGTCHLQELREVIYEQVRPYPDDKLLQNLPEYFALQHTQHLRGKMNLSNTETIMNLLAMTPHYWRIRPEQKEKLLKLDRLSCIYDMHLSRIQFKTCSSTKAAKSEIT